MLEFIFIRYAMTFSADLPVTLQIAEGMIRGKKKKWNITNLRTKKKGAEGTIDPLFCKYGAFFFFVRPI